MVLPKHTWPDGHAPTLAHVAGGGGPQVRAGSTHAQVINEPPPLSRAKAWQTLPSRHGPPQIGYPEKAQGVIPCGKQAH
jgi:hypothetical protein